MKKERTFQSRIADEMIRYISFKRALKRSFETASTMLLRLDRFLHQLGEPAADLTAETFSQWCDTMQGRSPNTRQGRMRVVRNFCLYRQRSHPDCFVPDLNHLPEPHPLTEPYLFSDADVASLLSHSDSIADSVRSPLRGTATRLTLPEILNRPAGYASGFRQAHASQTFGLFIRSQPPYLALKQAHYSRIKYT